MFWRMMVFLVFPTARRHISNANPPTNAFRSGGSATRKMTVVIAVMNQRIAVPSSVFQDNTNAPIVSAYIPRNFATVRTIVETIQTKTIAKTTRV